MELFAKKSLGQHFLNSPSVLAKIIEASQLQKGETVLEIGPGTGVLTQELLKSGVKLIAVEKDVRAYELLKEKFSANISDGSLSLLMNDIIKLKREDVGLENNKYKIVANIPYYITGMILESFLEYAPRPSMMVLLVQKEVAERIVARDNKESVLSISVKSFGVPEIVAKVPRGAFVPPPNVESAVLKIDNISDAKFHNIGLQTKLFFDLIHAGFAHKRKFLQSNLSTLYSREILEQIWTELQLDPKVRAEDLRPDTWFDIAKKITL